MIYIVVLIALLWLVFSNFIEATVVEEKFNVYCPVYSPSLLYENTKMNWFGCWFIFILIRLFIPINTLICVAILAMSYIWAFIEWIFTVGRKDD